jgi:lipoic acid synthetase
MGLVHAVVTAVNRDDLEEGGAGHFAATIREIRASSPGTRVEVLVSDFLGNWEALDLVLDASPDILAHNLETVPRLYRRVRPDAEYERSLDILARAAATKRAFDAAPWIKSGLMLGLGEEEGEVLAVLEDLRAHGGEIVSLGQYLPPTPRHIPAARWVHPEEFVRYARHGARMGFLHVESGPLVRSSYHVEAQGSSAGIPRARVGPVLPAPGASPPEPGSVPRGRRSGG